MRRRLRAKERDRAFLLAWLLRRKPEGAQPARAELPRVRGHLARAFSRAPAGALQPAVRLGDAATEDAGRETVRLEDLAGPACEHCGAPIPEGKRIDAAFCSRRCATKSHHAAESLALAEARAGRTCPECGGPVVAKTSRKRFCSASCLNAAYWRRRRAEVPERACLICGDRFRPRSVYIAETVKTCSKRCAAIMGRRNRPLLPEVLPKQVFGLGGVQAISLILLVAEEGLEPPTRGL